MPLDLIKEWPIWLVAALLLVNLFKDQIGAFVPTAVREHFSSQARRQADEREHAQEIEEVKLNAALQTNASDDLRKSWREENLMDLLAAKDDWERTILRDEIIALRGAMGEQIKELQDLRRAAIRTNDLLTTLNIIMSRLSEANGQN